MFCCLIILVRLSVPVQVIDWKDLLMGSLNPTHWLTQKCFYIHQRVMWLNRVICVFVTDNAKWWILMTFSVDIVPTVKKLLAFEWSRLYYKKLAFANIWQAITCLICSREKKTCSSNWKRSICIYLCFWWWRWWWWCVNTGRTTCKPPDLWLQTTPVQTLTTAVVHVSHFTVDHRLAWLEMLVDRQDCQYYCCDFFFFFYHQYLLFLLVCLIDINIRLCRDWMYVWC